MPRSIAALDSPSFCEILLMALGLDKNDYQLGITKVFFRAGKLAFLDELTGSEYKELAPDIANKVRIWLIKKRWRRHTIAVVAFLRLKRTLADLRLVRKLYSAASFMVLIGRVSDAEGASPAQPHSSPCSSSRCRCSWRTARCSR